LAKQRSHAAVSPRRRTARGASLVLCFPSGTEFLSLVRDLTRQLATLSGFPAASADRVALAVDECATNVIRHAYHGESGRDVEIRFYPDGDELAVEVLDEGDSVDPRSMPRVDLERYASERRKGGLGVHLMGKIMDSVSYRRAECRNVCRMVKRKPASDHPAR